MSTSENQPSNFRSLPFFAIVDRLATFPAFGPPVSPADLATLTPAQQAAIFSGDWGLIQKQLVIENPDLYKEWECVDSNPWCMVQVTVEGQALGQESTGA